MILQLIDGLNGGGAERLCLNIHKNLNSDVITIYLNSKNNLLDTGFDKKIFGIKSNFKMIRIIKLIFLINLHKCDIIITHSPYTSIIANLFFFKRKVFSYLHNNPDNLKNNIKDKTIINLWVFLIYKFSNKIIGASDTVFSKKSKKNITLFNSIDCKKFTNTDTERTKTAIVVGSFTEQKNQLQLINEIEKHKNLIDITFYGQGVLKKSCELKANSFSNKIKFAGFEKNIQDIYNKTNYVIVVSLYESLSLAWLEAISCGCKLLVLNRNCYSETLKKELRNTVFFNNISDILSYILLNPTPLITEELPYKFCQKNWLNQINKIIIQHND
jgi:glycosyltransferase involved in cell wall biosynthesis